MSFTKSFNQGVYEIETPASFLLIAILATFQYCELASGLNAKPTSPIAPLLASGLILIKGTAVVIVL